MASLPGASALVDASNVVEDGIQTRWPAVERVLFEPDHLKAQRTTAAA